MPKTLYQPPAAYNDRFPDCSEARIEPHWHSCDASHHQRRGRRRPNPCAGTVPRPAGRGPFFCSHRPGGSEHPAGPLPGLPGYCCRCRAWPGQFLASLVFAGRCARLVATDPRPSARCVACTQCRGRGGGPHRGQTQPDPGDLHRPWFRIQAPGPPAAAPVRLVGRGLAGGLDHTHDLCFLA